MGGPYLFGSEGWKLVPRALRRAPRPDRDHRPRRVDRRDRHRRLHTLSLGIGAAAVLGVALTAAMWWAYFDIVAIVAGRRLADAEPGRAQNEMARDSYSYLHLPMIAGIVLVALGLKTTIGHFDDHLHAVPAFALLGGLAIYLLGHVAFRYRHVHTINRQRLLLAIVLLILVPVATEVPALAALAVANLLIWAMIAYETRSYGEGRRQAPPPRDRGGLSALAAQRLEAFRRSRGRSRAAGSRPSGRGRRRSRRRSASGCVRDLAPAMKPTSTQKAAIPRPIQKTSGMSGGETIEPPADGPAKPSRFRPIGRNWGSANATGMDEDRRRQPETDPRGDDLRRLDDLHRPDDRRDRRSPSSSRTSRSPPPGCSGSSTATCSRSRPCSPSAGGSPTSPATAGWS